jgi:hypothetical protein
MAFNSLIFIVGFPENPKNIEICLKGKAQSDNENVGLSLHADCTLADMLMECCVPHLHRKHSGVNSQ